MGELTPGQVKCEKAGVAERSHPHLFPPGPYPVAQGRSRTLWSEGVKLSLGEGEEIYSFSVCLSFSLPKSILNDNKLH